MKTSTFAYIIFGLAVLLNVYLTFTLNAKIKERRLVDYPTNSTNIVDLGNGWSSFQLKVMGRNRLFIRHVFTETGSEALTVVPTNAKEVISK